jgi:tetratricopeptide (TPR) repeat protein
LSVSENPRIEELRRRVQKDPASIAFAQLAEEYRRAGSYEDAVSTCRAGLAIHPGYLSARVTLGRALIEINDLEGAGAELTVVLRSAPENLSAIRGLAEIHHRIGQLDKALGFYQTALGLARHDPDLEQTVSELTRALTPERPAIADGLSFEQATAEFLSAVNAQPAPASAQSATAGEPVAPIAPVAPVAPNDAPVEPVALPQLERFLDAIHTYRQRRAV